MAEGEVRLAALGGLGEIGLNLMVLECAGQAIVIDAGVMFPEERAFGIDVIVPELAYLSRVAPRLAGVVLTHAHEDHIGALPLLLKRFNAPVYGSRLTLEFVRQRLQERGGLSQADLRGIEARRAFQIGPFAIEPLAVTHSTPDSMALAIGTPAGLIVHTGDFKLDEAPVDGRRSDLDRFAELGEQGVTLLLSDSTNVERPGRSASESSLKPALHNLMAATRGKFFLTAFSSHIHRMRQTVEVSRELGRRVTALGRRMTDSLRTGVDHGYLPDSSSVLIDDREAEFFADRHLTFLTSGSQGEPLSALVRIAANNHPRVRVGEGDTVVLSSRAIPGNERIINRLIDQLYKRGAEVFYEPVVQVHASGHACQDELAQMIRLTRPKFFVPIHGEYRHLVRHGALAARNGVAERNCLVLEDGDSLVLDRGEVRRGPRVECGRLILDGEGLEDPGLLSERRALARDGTVTVVVATDRVTGELLAGPELYSRGVVSGDGTSPVLRNMRRQLREQLERERSRRGRGEQALKDELVRTLRHQFDSQLARRPMIVACVIEI